MYKIDNGLLPQEINVFYIRHKYIHYCEYLKVHILCQYLIMECVAVEC